MPKPMPGVGETDTIKRKAAFSARFAGNTQRRYKYLQFIEREFDGASWRTQAKLMKALAGVARQYPRHSQRILRFLGQRTRAEHFTPAWRPHNDETPHSRGARGYVPLVLRKLIQAGRGDEVLRFVRRTYASTDAEGRGHCLSGLKPLATTRHKEHADAFLRLAARFLHREPTAQHFEWVRLGVEASQHANAAAAIEFFKSAYEYAPPEDRERIHRRLLEFAGTSAAGRVVQAAGVLAQERDNWTRTRMALLLHAVIAYAREWHDEGLVGRALGEQRQIQLLGRKSEAERRRQGHRKLQNDRQDHDLGT